LQLGSPFVRHAGIRIADHIAARIAAGDLPAEARLPAGRDLAAEYAVALGAARRAVLELHDRGLVMTLSGQGTYVVSPPRTGAKHGRYDPQRGYLRTARRERGLIGTVHERGTYRT